MKCPWCNDERLELLITMLEDWANEGKVLLTARDWIQIAHAVHDSQEMQP